MSAANVVIHPQHLTDFVAAMLRAAGSQEREAELVSTNLVRANLSGHDSHGVGMMPWYINFIESKGLVPNQHVKVTGEFGAMVMLDGQRGYGQVIGHEAMLQGIARAQRSGLALVALCQAHHVGRIGQWAEDCAAAGLVSIHFVNALLRPLVAPYAGSDARFTTNPFCVGVPREGKAPVLLDFATSKVALGKVRVAMQSEREMAPGTLIDARGYPTTDPHVMFEADVAGKLGAILPFGEHKGYGMALICEILGGALTGGETLHEVGDYTGIYNNMLSIIIDPDRLGGQKHREQMEAFITWVKQSPPAPGHDKVRISGEPELEMRARRGHGIPIDINTWDDLQRAAEQAGMSAAEVQRFALQAKPE
jgi:uncharacterized oxidoreductase